MSNPDKHWQQDRPSTDEEAFELLRFGAVMNPLMEDQLVDQARTERRMLACADYFKRALAEALARAEKAAYANADALRDLSAVPSLVATPKLEGKPWEQHPVRTLHACVDTLASAFKDYLPWPDDMRSQVERGHEMLIEDTVKRADACMTIIEHAARVSPQAAPYRCGECGKEKPCSDTFCAWAGPAAPSHRAAPMDMSLITELSRGHTPPPSTTPGDVIEMIREYGDYRQREKGYKAERTLGNIRSAISSTVAIVTDDHLKEIYDHGRYEAGPEADRHMAGLRAVVEAVNHPIAVSALSATRRTFKEGLESALEIAESYHALEGDPLIYFRNALKNAIRSSDGSHHTGKA